MINNKPANSKSLTTHTGQKAGIFNTKADTMRQVMEIAKKIEKERKYSSLDFAL